MPPTQSMRPTVRAFTRRGHLLALVLALVLAVAEALGRASYCISAADCCSFVSATDPHGQRPLPCCGSAREGPGANCIGHVQALSCSDDGICHRGTAPCRSSMDDPLCNIPNAVPASSATSEDGGVEESDPLATWRACRSDSAKMQALLDSQRYGSPAIHTAAMHGRTDAVAWLLEEGVATDARGQSEATALHSSALTRPGTSAMQLLLANGADPNVIDAFGFTPLHRAIQAGSVEAATLLLSSGANITITAPGGETPLHLAAYENSRDLALLLVAFGADPFARNERGVMSFEIGLFDMSVPPFHMA